MLSESDFSIGFDYEEARGYVERKVDVVRYKYALVDVRNGGKVLAVEKAVKNANDGW